MTDTFKTANQLPHLEKFTLVINEDKSIKLDGEKLEKLDVCEGDLIEVSISKIPEHE